MKFTLGLFAILAIIGLGQAHQLPDFGKGPLHEDLQDILDLVPVEKIVNVTVDYIINDKEVQEFFKELTTSVIKDLMVDLQAIPEVIKFLNYLHKEGLDVYQMINRINKALEIKELVPPSSQVSPSKRTGGLRGMFQDIKKHIDYDVFISIYVDKLKTSKAFVNFIDQLKSDNFQQIVNKVTKIEAYQFIVSRLEARSVNLKIVGDILYLLFGINVPSPAPSKKVVKELEDFYKLVPWEEFLNILIEYINEDEKVQKALLFMFTTEFHDLLRALEATKEHQAIVAYLEKAGFPISEYIQELHRAIGMEKYVPPKVKSYFMSLIKTQKVGDGMQGLIKDLYNVLPLDKIDALYQKKMETSKVFVNFIEKITSTEMLKMARDLYTSKTYREFITKTKEKGLDIEGLAYFNMRIIGLKLKPLF